VCLRLRPILSQRGAEKSRGQEIKGTGPLISFVLAFGRDGGIADSPHIILLLKFNGCSLAPRIFVEMTFPLVECLIMSEVATGRPAVPAICTMFTQPRKPGKWG